MFVFIGLLLFLVNSCEGELRVYNYTQRLDHFDKQNNFTFQQRMVISDRHWAGSKARAPIIAVLGGLNDYGGDGYDAYPVLQLSAVKFKALLIFIELRFQGNSIPLGSIKSAMSDRNVRKHLTTQQALQDHADIIQSLKANLSAHNSPVIVVGSVYGGALATWFRLKYPKIAIGALASSTPLLYYGSSTPGHGYCLTVSTVFKDVNPSCYNHIRRAWKDIDEIALQSNGLAKLSQIFSTCRPLQSSDEVKQCVAQIFSFAVAYDTPANEEVKDICQEIVNPNGTIEGFVSVTNIELGNTQKCLGTDVTVTRLDSPFEPISKSRIAWAWMRCTELIFPVGCVKDTMLPSKPFDMAQFKKSCQEIFGEVIHPHPPRNFYGIHNMEEALIKYGRNIIFSNGLNDPLSNGGILKNISETIVAITVANLSSSWDMKAIPDDDSELLMNKVNDEVEIFERWINQHHQNNKSNPLICSCFIYFLLNFLVFMILSY